MKVSWSAIMLMCCCAIFTAEAQTNPIDNHTTEIIEGSWILTTNLYVGEYTSDNNLIITNGGHVDSSGLAYVGYEASSSGNSVVITGSGSRWDCSGLSVGWYSSNNSVEILNGAILHGPFYSSYVGTLLYADNNTVHVDGSGSVWNTYMIYMYWGANNSIHVSGGGALNSSYSLAIGAGSTGKNNSLTVEGTNSTATFMSDITLGIDYWDWKNNSVFTSEGIGNQLMVKDGAQCWAGGTIINRNGSTIEIGSASSLSALEYNMNNGSDLIITCAQNGPDTGLLDISGTVIIGGNLTVTAQSGMTFIEGYAANLINGTISGTFATVTLPVLPAGLEWDTSLLYSDGVIFIPGLLDQDSDLISDTWEVMNFGSITACNPGDDTDDDGHTHYQEYIAGTDPNVKASCLDLSMQFQGGTRSFSWTPVEGRTYSLQYATDLGMSYTTLIEDLEYPQSSTVDNTPISGDRYYRLWVELK